MGASGDRLVPVCETWAGVTCIRHVAVSACQKTAINGVLTDMWWYAPCHVRGEGRLLFDTRGLLHLGLCGKCPAVNQFRVV